MFDEDRCDTLLFDDAQGFFDLIHNHGREAFIWLIKQKHLDVACKCACDGEHLLFTTRERNTLLFAALFEAREELIKTIKRPADGRSNLGKLQVFLNCQAGNDAAVFWHKANTRLSRLVA